MFEAHDQEWNEQVALKVLLPQRHHALGRFKREFRNLADVRHPNLVALHQLFVDDDATYFTMQLVRGRDFRAAFRDDAPANAPLASRAKSAHTTPWGDTLDAAGTAVDPPHELSRATALLEAPASERLLHALRQLAEGLHHLHRSGWAHRDIKPSNILVATDDQLVLLDFGLADDLGPARIRGHANEPWFGTPGYVAPEQLAAAAPSRASDWWAVGVVLAETLVGHAERHELARWLERTRAGSVTPVQCCLIGIALDLLDPDPQRRPTRDDIARRLDGIDGYPRKGTSSARTEVVAPFVGRARELAALHGAFEELRRGGGSWVRIRGTAGVGKSALIAAFANTLASRPDVWLFSTICRDRELVPFRSLDPLMDQLGITLQSVPEIATEIAAIDHADAIARVFKTLPLGTRATQIDLTPQNLLEQRRVVFAAWREVMARIASKRRLILIIDDAQWGDTDSALLLSLLIERPAPILMVVAHRHESAESEFLSGLDASLMTHGRAWIDIDLEALETAEANELVTQLLGPSARSARRLDKLLQQAGGLPIFLVTLAASMDDLSPHESLEAVLARRLSALPPVASALLQSTALSPAPLREEVLLSATEGMERAHEWLVALDIDRLLLRRPSASGNLLEPFHDRVRQAVLGTLEPAESQHRHSCLAAAIQRIEGDDARPEVLFAHYAGAGEGETASHYGEAAADQAVRALAFDNASFLFREAANLTASTERKLRLIERHGDVLVAAGRTAAGAAVYEGLSEHLHPPAQRVIQRKAAEAYLITGHQTEGLRIWRRLARELGLRFPRSTVGAAVGALITVVCMHRWVSARHRSRPALTQARADAALAAAKGLIAIDPMRGTYFGLQSLFHARAAGRAESLVMSLSFVAAACLAAAGGALRRWAISLLDEAEEYSATARDGYLRAVVTIARAQIALFQGKWRAATEAARTGLDALRATGHARTWEANMAYQARTRGLEEIGAFQELMTEANDWRAHAEERGDAFGSVTALLTLGAGSLATGNASDADGYAQNADECWNLPGYSVQRFYAARIRILSAVQRGDLDGAEQQLRLESQRVRSSMIFRIPTGRIDTLWMESRVALARIAAGHSTYKAQASVLLRNARRLEREDHEPARAHGRFIHGVIAGIQMARAKADSDFGLAAALYRQTGMEPMSILVELCRMKLLGPADAAPAMERLAMLGITDPYAWARGYGVVL